jgi:hypothetical protein
MCHLDVIELTGTDVARATCGRRGELGPGPAVRWTDRSTPVSSMAEKRARSRTPRAATAHWRPGCSSGPAASRWFTPGTP